MKTWYVVFAIGLSAAACSSGSTSASSSTAGTSSGAGGSGSTTSAGGGSGSSTSGVGGASGAGGAGDCQTPAGCIPCCEALSPAAYDVFKSYHLQGCACGDAQAPCHAACTTGTDVCANPAVSGDACTACLVMELAKQKSTCTYTSLLGCHMDAACGPFFDCVDGCL